MFPGGAKVAVFSWYSADLTTAGQVVSAYVSGDTPMQAYSNVHKRLEARRDIAAQGGTRGPRVMVVGPTDSGKTSTCRILLSYAVRRGRTPAFVDLDVGQGSITVPGVISATPVEKSSLTVLEGFRHSVPLSYFYGDVTLSGNPELFKRLVRRLAETLNTRITDPLARASGLIINTAGWVEGTGKELLIDAARALEVDIVLVMGQDKLHADLKRALGSAREGGPGAAASGGAGGAAAGGTALTGEATVIKIPRSGGVVDRTTPHRRAARARRIREYFYGVDNTLSPATLDLTFDEVRVFSVKSLNITAAMMPVGTESTLDPVSVSEEEITASMLHSTLAVSYGSGADDIATANVAGFVNITSIDVEAKKLQLLAPCSGPLPSNLLVLGHSSLKWFE